mmetsp:Transcript_3245/g.4785  ORF Transcript_3245/g.4785 Transcript_3245/m.4785 type:complete len:121 (+) Transcript_3245:16-378(+)
MKVNIVNTIVYFTIASQQFTQPQTTMSKYPTLGKSLLLSSILAFLSYLPFEAIAKGTLVFCAFTFVNDPFPPTSRVVAVCGVIVVLILSNIERKWREGQDKFLEEVSDKPKSSEGGIKKD